MAVDKKCSLWFHAEFRVVEILVGYGVQGLYKIDGCRVRDHRVMV